MLYEARNPSTNHAIDGVAGIFGNGLRKVSETLAYFDR